MAEKQIINLNPEFGCELALGIPYAYWLHKNNQLEKVITSKGMKPFYYFCDNVEEKYEHRTIDNVGGGLNTLPNDWIHGVKPIEEPGVLDYSKWEPPAYIEHYANDSMTFDKPFVVIANKYTVEHGEPPAGYFSIDCLIDIFEYFKTIGYYVIYKRPTNTEFPVDQNDANAVHMKLNLTKEINGKVLSDFDLVEQYNNVISFNDIVNDNLEENYSASLYNEIQLQLFVNSDGFITPSGGGSILCSCFGKKVLIYATHSGEMRPGYFNDNSYYKKLSNSDLFVVYDDHRETKKRGYNDYTEMMTKIKEIWV